MNTLLQGAEQAVSAERSKLRWALGLSGALSIALGIVIIVWPVALIAAFALIIGAAELTVAIRGGRLSDGGRKG